MSSGNTMPPPRRHSQINVPVLCTLLFLYIAYSQALNTKPFIFKENEEKAVVEMIIPETPKDLPLLTVKSDTNGEDENSTIFFLYLSDMVVKLKDQYKNVISASSDTDQRKVLLEYDVMKLAFAETYKCFKGTTSNIIDDCGFKLIVLAKPTEPVIKVSEDSSLLVGGTTTLDCEFKSNTMPPDHGLKPLVIWKDGEGQEVTSSSSSRVSVSEERLVIADITREDNGMIFVCLAADNPGAGKDEIFSNSSSEFKIVPQYPPGDSDFTVTPTFVNSTKISKPENAELRYECSVDCQPACKVEWKRLLFGKKGYTSIPRPEDPAILFLDAVSRKDQGSYICVGENDHGRNNIGFDMDVLYILTPEVVVSGSRAWVKSVTEGDKEEVLLSCFIDSNPGPSVVWKDPENWLLNHSKTLIGPDNQVSNNSLKLHRYTSEISLTDLKCEKGGSYKCQAENSLKITRTGAIEIEVKCEPSAVVSDQYDGLDNSKILQKEYVWELGNSLKGNFIIRGWPQPRVKRVTSSFDGVTREESLQSAMTIGIQHSYMGKPYLTLYDFQSLRVLTLNDRGRVYKFTLENSEFEKDFTFVIQPRGPPLPVLSLNTTKISHNSITVSWVPGFDGGEAQTFSIFARRKPSSSSSGSSNDEDWKLVVSDVEESSDSSSGEFKVTSLSAGTSYEIMVKSMNSRGNATTSIIVKTHASPASSADTGAIVGAVFAVIIVLVIVVLVLLYIFVYKKRWGRDKDGEIRIPMIGRMSKIFRGRGKKRDPNGNVGSSGLDSKRPSRFKPIFRGKSNPPKPKEKDYSNVPTESVDPTECVDPTGEYVNADSIPRKRSWDAHPRSTSDPDPDLDVGKGDCRMVTDDGLTYVQVDFQGPPPKPKRLESKDSPAAFGDAGDTEYSSIDFEKTRVKEEEIRRLEEEELRRREEEEERRRKREEESEEEEHYENLQAFGTTV